MGAALITLVVNDTPRLCLRWTDGGVEDVEIVDYH